MKAARINLPFFSNVVLMLLFLAGSLIPARGGLLELVSRRDASQPPSATAGGDSMLPIISPDGRFVLFSSTANNLVLTGSGTQIPASQPPNLNVYCRDRSNSGTILISQSLDGLSGGDGNSIPLAISTNGQFILFESRAGNLVPGDTNQLPDVFVRDMQNETTELVSISTDGNSGNGTSSDAVMTPDGRYIAFSSTATNLVVGDTNQIEDVFLRDRITGTTHLVSVGATSTGSVLVRSISRAPEITPDGRYIAFFSTATNLVPGAQTLGEVFVRDRVLGTTYYASTNAKSLLQPAALTSTTVSGGYRISNDGSHVAFIASANTLNTSSLYLRGWLLRHDLQSGLTEVIHTNALVPRTAAADFRTLDMTPDGRFIAFVAYTNATGFTGGDASCILRWDAQASTMTLISGNLSNAVVAGSRSDWPVINPDGQHIAFFSSATNLTTNTMAGEFHLFSRDVAAGTSHLIDVDSTGVGVDFNAIPRMSADGGLVAFASPDSNLVPNDQNRARDVFVRNLDLEVTELISAHHPALPSITPNGASGLASFSVSTNGRYVAFSSDATDLTSGDFNKVRDVFVHDLLEQTNTPVSVATNGGSGAGVSSDAQISGNGRYVAFTSAASNLVAMDLNNARDVFVRDRLTAGTTLASASYSSNLISVGRDSFSPQLSRDGRFVLFQSEAAYLTTDNLGSGNKNLFLRDLEMSTNFALTTATLNTGVTDASITPNGQFVAYAGRIGSGDTLLYVWDTALAARIYTNTTLSIIGVSISPGGRYVAFLGDTPTSLHLADREANTNWFISAGKFMSPATTGMKFSDDGRYLAYATAASNSPDDTNSTQDVYLYDLVTGTNVLLSRGFASGAAANGPSDSPGISPDGRFVAFRSSADDIVPGDDNGVSDLIIVDRQNNSTILVGVNRTGHEAADNYSMKPVFSADSSTLTFQSWATDLQDQDFNFSGDLFQLKLTAPAIVDTDEDGMDDQWEWYYFDTLDRTGEGDFDLDGAADRFEFQSGTSPTNSASLFQVEIDWPAANQEGPALRWPAREWGSYRVQFKDQAGDAGWQDLESVVTLLGNTGFSADLTPAPVHRYYRIVLSQ